MAIASSISVSETTGPGRPVGHDSQSIGLTVVVGFGISLDIGNLSGEDTGWLPSSPEVVTHAPYSLIGCTIVFMFVLDIFELEQAQRWRQSRLGRSGRRCSCPSCIAESLIHVINGT